MFAGILLCAALLAGAEPAGVQVRLVYSASEGKPEAKVEPWIVMTVTKSSEEVALPMTGWVSLKSSDDRIFMSNGCYIDGMVIEKNGKYEVDVSGCNGGELRMRATLKPGERGVFKLEGSGGVFVAVKAPKRE